MFAKNKTSTLKYTLRLRVSFRCTEKLIWVYCYFKVKSNLQFAFFSGINFAYFVSFYLALYVATELLETLGRDEAKDLELVLPALHVLEVVCAASAV